MTTGRINQGAFFRKKSPAFEISLSLPPRRSLVGRLSPRQQGIPENITSSAVSRRSTAHRSGLAFRAPPRIAPGLRANNRGRFGTRRDRSHSKCENGARPTETRGERRGGCSPRRNLPTSAGGRPILWGTLPGRKEREEPERQTKKKKLFAGLASPRADPHWAKGRPRKRMHSDAERRAARASARPTPTRGTFWLCILFFY
jgi:hypothetical protein